MSLGHIVQIERAFERLVFASRPQLCRARCGHGGHPFRKKWLRQDLRFPLRRFLLILWSKDRGEIGVGFLAPSRPQKIWKWRSFATHRTKNADGYCSSSLVRD